jgi:hypothetical protein
LEQVQSEKKETIGGVEEESQKQAIAYQKKETPVPIME